MLLFPEPASRPAMTVALTVSLVALSRVDGAASRYGSHAAMIAAAISA